MLYLQFRIILKKKFWKSPGEEFVFVIDKDNQAQKVFIQRGYAENGMVEVIEGLEDGATIISEGARLVNQNQPVQIIE